MTENNNKQNREIDKSFLVKSVLGVSPIPIVGEIALSSLFYDLFKEGMNDLRHVAIPAALLTRFGMYTHIYIPLYQKASELFGN